MRKLKEDILKLRGEGKSYQQICDILHCSKSVVSYHCGEGQKEKNNTRRKRNRKINFLQDKVTEFSRRLNIKINRFSKIKRTKRIEYSQRLFSMVELKEHIKNNPVCYLTGEQLDITSPSGFHLDHIIPRSKGGSSELSNLGITTPNANMAKSDMMLDEFIDLCKKVLLHNGYEVKKKQEQQENTNNPDIPNGRL